MSDILAAIDGALEASAHTSAEVTGNPWPGRVPSLDEMLEAVFGPEDGADLPDYAIGQLLPSDVAHRVNAIREQMLSRTLGTPSARQGRSVDYVIEDEVLRFGTDRPYLRSMESELRRQAVLESIARMGPPDLSAFRLIAGTGA